MLPYQHCLKKVLEDVWFFRCEETRWVPAAFSHVMLCNYSMISSQSVYGYLCQVHAHCSNPIKIHQVSVDTFTRVSQVLQYIPTASSPMEFTSQELIIRDVMETSTINPRSFPLRTKLFCRVVVPLREKQNRGIFLEQVDSDRSQQNNIVVALAVISWVFLRLPQNKVCKEVYVYNRIYISIP